jgi:hypothetical protein
VRRLPAVLPALALALLPGPAHAQGADAQGWWSTLHRAAAPAPPAPPDVGASDLLLQGGDVERAVPGTGSSPAPSALAALRFHLAPGGQVGSLVLQVAAHARAADVRAYPTTAPWVPAQDGAIEDAPAADPSRYSPGSLSADGLTLVFPDIGRLVTDDGLLSVVLLPGPTDRVVVHAPLPTALTVVRPTRAPAQPSPAPPRQPAAVPAAVPVEAVSLPPVAPAPAVVPAQPQPAPAVAAATTSTTTTGGHRVVPDPSRDRLVVGLEALLVLAFFGLLGQGPFAALARLTGQPVEERTARGVGRFVKPRTGAPPRL